MEITVLLYKFSKKFNSTKQPSGTGKEAKVVWKTKAETPLSTDTPMIEMYADDVLAGYNYVYIPQFERYYWIDKNMKYRNKNHADVKLITDVLATYKPYLMNQTFFIDKNQFNYNSTYSDNRIACGGSRLVGESTADIPELSDSPYAMFYAEIVGAEPNGTFTDRYILAPNELGRIAEKIMLDVDFHKAYVDGVAEAYDNESLEKISSVMSNLMMFATPSIINEANQHGADAKDLMQGGIGGILGSFNAMAESLQEAILKPSESIVKILALACDVPTLFDTVRQNIYLGKVDSQISGRFLNNSLSTLKTLILDIPWQYISQDGGISDFRNRAEYTTATLVLPSGDTVSLPVNRMYNHTNLNILYRINASTGEFFGQVALSVSGDIIASFVFNIGSPISTAYRNEMFGGVVLGAMESIPNIVAGVGGSFAGGSAGMGFMSIAHSFSNVVNPLLEAPVATVHGSTTNCMLMNKKFSIIISSIQTQPPSELNPLGRLLRKPMQLSSLTGFTVCEEAYAEVPATYEEQQRLNTFLNNGFYIE